MQLRAAFLGTSCESCAYFPERQQETEKMYVEAIGSDILSILIATGYRHFGNFFFRPICRECHACIPIRIPVDGYHFPRSARKLFKKNADLDVRVVHQPGPSPEAFRLYLQHKERFDPVAEEPSSYRDFAETFFCRFPFSYALEIRHGEKLIGVSHFDQTREILSAIYCYYDQSYLKRSLGRFAVYELIRHALGGKIPHLYLGFYLQENAHMKYKRDYRPSEVLLEEGCWVPFVDRDNREQLPPEKLQAGFQPNFRLQTTFIKKEKPI